MRGWGRRHSFWTKRIRPFFQSWSRSFQSQTKPMVLQTLCLIWISAWAPPPTTTTRTIILPVPATESLDLWTKSIYDPTRTYLFFCVLYFKLDRSGSFSFRYIGQSSSGVCIFVFYKDIDLCCICFHIFIMCFLLLGGLRIWTSASLHGLYMYMYQAFVLERYIISL